MMNEVMTIETVGTPFIEKSIESSSTLIEVQQNAKMCDRRILVCKVEKGSQTLNVIWYSLK